MADITKLSLTIDFAHLLVTQDQLWLPIHDIQSSLIGRKVLVRRSVVIPANTQMVLPAYVEDSKHDFLFSEDPLMLEVNKNIISEFGVVPAKSLYQEFENEIPVLLYNTNECKDQ